MPITDAPRRNLATTLLAFGERGGVLLQEPEAASPVLGFEVVPHAVTGPQGTWVSGKGAGALRFYLHKTNVKDLQDVFRLTDQKPVSVNLWLCPTNTPSVRRHQYPGKLYSEV